MGSRAAGNNKTVLTISSAKVIHKADEVSSKLGTPSPWKIGDPVPAGLLKESGFFRRKNKFRSFLKISQLLEEIPTEHIDMENSSECKLQKGPICSMRKNACFQL